MHKFPYAMDIESSISERVRNTVPPVLPPRIRELLEGGVITVDFHLTQDGLDLWGRCTQPHPRLGLTTFQSYDLYTLMGELDKVKITPKPKATEGVKIPPVSSPSSKEKKKAEMDPSLISKRVLSLGDAIAFDRKQRVGSIKLNGVTNNLPKSSLCYRDFLRDIDFVQARAFLVSEQLGASVIRSRISTSDSLYMDSVRDIGSWWELANPSQRLQVLATASSLGQRVVDDTTVSELLRNLQCPFQDPETTVVSKAVEREEEGFPTLDL